ncbi:hypothetical protein Pelo_11800 [Pelomyxa schiedti]|nr:hypothetical protein Pelo_11800 [Pelomyxa schiedti]
MIRIQDGLIIRSTFSNLCIINNVTPWDPTKKCAVFELLSATDFPGEKNLNLVFVVDMSGSMGSQLEDNPAMTRAALVKQYLQAMVNTQRLFHVGDYLSVVSFGDFATVHVVGTLLETEEQVANVKEEISQLPFDPDGKTNFTSGLEEAVEQLRNAPGHNNSIIIALSDGGLDEDAAQVSALISRYNEYPFSCICIPFGRDGDIKLHSITTGLSGYSNMVVKMNPDLMLAETAKLVAHYRTVDLQQVRCEIRPANSSIRLRYEPVGTTELLPASCLRYDEGGVSLVVRDIPFLFDTVEKNPSHLRLIAVPMIGDVAPNSLVATLVCRWRTGTAQHRTGIGALNSQPEKKTFAIQNIKQQYRLHDALLVQQGRTKIEATPILHAAQGIMRNYLHDLTGSNTETMVEDQNDYP